jgi:hypothetical protein
MSDDPRRQLFHDLRGVIAAAHANVEYLREQGLPLELASVVDEISCELRLVADAISQLGTCDPERHVELDLRALLWFAARHGARLRIDPTAPPFVVRGSAGALSALVEALGRAVAPGGHGTLEVAVKQGARATCTVHGLDRGAALDRALELAKELSLTPRLRGAALVLLASND